MEALVGVKLAVGVELGGTRVDVGLGTGVSCNLQPESETRIQIAEITARNNRCDLVE